MDLALADGLLGLELATEVELHLEASAIFVSDAMPAAWKRRWPRWREARRARHRFTGSTGYRGSTGCFPNACPPRSQSNPAPAVWASGSGGGTDGTEASHRLVARLREHLRQGRLRAVTHWFYTAGLHYYQLPDDLYAGLHECRLVIVRGDTNYRRLLGDTHWPSTASFAATTGLLPRFTVGPAYH